MFVIMNKFVTWLNALLLFFSLGFVSCAKDTVVADPYADWQVRNEHYIDSIADVAHANVTGDWEIYKNYKLDFVEPGVGIVSPELGVADYVYVQYIEKGSGTVPLYTDSVSVNYEGMLIDGTVFDACLDDKIYDPITFALNDTGLREGWKVAFQHIPAGSHFKLYIHPDLGYGNADYGDIPASSVLIFEIKFQEVIHPVGPDGRALPLLEDEES